MYGKLKDESQQHVTKEEDWKTHTAWFQDLLEGYIFKKYNISE